MLTVLSASAFAFACTKLFFGLLGWYSQIEQDQLYRKHLDEIWDNLYSQTSAQIVHGLLSKLVMEGNRLWKGFHHPLIGFLFISASANLLSYVIGASAFELGIAGELVTLRALLGLPARTQLSFGHSWAIAMLLSAMLVLFDCLSLFVTWKLLKRAVQSESLFVTAMHLIADFVVTYLAVVWSFASYFLVLAMIRVDVFSLTEIGIGLSRALISPLAFILGPRGFGAPAFVLLASLGFTAALPTILYSLIGATLLAMHAAPRWIRTVLLRVIFLVSTDRTPVLAQLGSFFGGLAALFAGLAAMLR